MYRAGCIRLAWDATGYEKIRHDTRITTHVRNKLGFTDTRLKIR